MVYYANDNIIDGVSVPRGTINLTEGRGVRRRQHCDLEWPSDAKSGLGFGLATENRTYYFYGTDKEVVRWVSTIGMQSLSAKL